MKNNEYSLFQYFNLQFASILLHILFFTFYFISCSPTEPDNGLQLQLEEVSCTEAWINIKGETGSEIILKRDNKEVKKFTLISSPQVVYDDSLQPNKTYTYQVSSIKNHESSIGIQVTTLDTTSHNFIWQTYTFGGNAGSCTLYDVAIIDENNIWAVGEINIADTSENGYTTYNAVHWNGNEWELKRITVEFRGFQITPPIEGVFAFSSNDVWFIGSLPIHGDGSNWIMYDLRTTLDPNISLSKAWGLSSDNMYFVGLNGNIAYYHKGQWSKIESGTDLNINDIFGAYNKQTGKYEIFATASNVLESLDRELLSIDGNSVSHLSTEPISSTLSSLWFKPNIKYFLSGDGIYVKNGLSEPGWKNKPLDITTYYTYRIRGNNINDLAASGGVGELIHFNGLSWRSHFENTKLQNGNYYGMDFKENIIAAVGQDNPKAVITIGRR